jgi:hypothetical protein
MLSAQLIRSVKNCDRSHVSEQEVLDKVRQLQTTSLCPKSVPQFYHGPAKVSSGSVACHMRKVVHTKQAEDRLSEVTELIHALRGGQDRITYTEFHQVSLMPHIRLFIGLDGVSRAAQMERSIASVQVLEEKNLTSSPFNFPLIFLRQHASYSSVCKRTLLDELECRFWRVELGMKLMKYDSDADGYLTLAEVQAWLSDLAGAIPV